MSQSGSETVESDTLVSTGKKNQVTNFRVPNFQYSVLGMFILYRLINNRDCKIIITSSGSTTGTGKTTLAILLCRFIRYAANDIFNMNKSWSAKEYASVDLNEYFHSYDTADKGDALLPDEIEFGADRRRSMSNENLHLSQAWQILRYKNVVSVATLPSTSVLDRRMLELGDIWINVVMRGRANTYYLTVDDFTGEIIRKRLKFSGFRESILWQDLPDGDRDFQYLKSQKEDLGVPGVTDEETQDPKEVKKEDRDGMIKSLLRLKTKGIVDMNQEEIAQEVSTAVQEVSQQHVSKVKRQMKNDNELPD